MTGLVRLAAPRLTLAELLDKARGPTDRDMHAALEAAASKLEPKLRQAFLDAVEALGRAVDTRRLVQLLEAGRIGDAVVLLDGALSSPNAWDPFKAGVVQAVQQAADAAAALSPRIPFGPGGVGGLDVRFNVLNPRTAEWLRRYTADLATELSEGARKAVNEAARVIIREGVTAGQGARQTAAQLKAAIGLNAQQERAARNYEAALRAGDMARAAEYRLRDKRFNHAKAPDSDEKIQRMVEGYRKKALAYRALVISRTESIRALHVGQHELWEQQVREGRVALEDLTRKWIYSADDKVRHAHKTIPRLNKNGVGLREPFKTELGPLMYPGDPAGKAANVINCRCTVITRLLPSAFAKPEAQPEKPPPKPAPKPAPKPKPLPDPLALRDKAPMETPWHDKSWDLAKAPRVLQDAIRRAPQVGVYHSPEHPFTTTHPGHVPEADRGAFKSWINLGPADQWRLDSAYARGMFRHEYGHHLDNQEAMKGGARAHSFAATAAVAADSRAILQQLKRERANSGAAQREYQALVARAERISRDTFADWDGPGSPGDAADRAENAALVEDARAALAEAKVKATLGDFTQPPAADETELETSFRLAGGAKQALRFIAALRTKSPQALARVASYDAYLMDFLGAITREDATQGKFGQGHGLAYYDRFQYRNRDGVNEGQTMEAFANYVEALGGGHAVKLLVMRALAPRTLRVFDKILAALAKGKVP